MAVIAAPNIWVNPMVGTTGVAIAFTLVHLYSKPLHRWFYRSEQIALSFSGGMAITYVFLHLLPELEQSTRLLGTPIHFMTLVGFLIFYGVQRWIWKVHQQNGVRYNVSLFWAQLAFASVYNFLLIYALPQQFKESTTLTVIYVIAMGLHLLSSDYGLSERNHQHFYRWGRYVLGAVIMAGLAVDLGTDITNDMLSDTLIAFLAGSLMSNVFEELPDHKTTSFRWFLAGVIVYMVLLSGHFAMDN